MTDKPTCIHHSPQRKLELRQELYNIVYERTFERFEEHLTEIRTKNMSLMGYGWDGFSHRGVYYGQEIPVKNQGGWNNTLRYQVRNQHLNDALVPAMDQLLAERQAVEKVEGVLVMSTLGSILNAARHVEDYKRLLPQLLHSHLDRVGFECSCEVPRLSDEEIAAVLAKHATYINKIKQRQLIYLLKP